MIAGAPPPPVFFLSAVVASHARFACSLLMQSVNSGVGFCCDWACLLGSLASVGEAMGVFESMGRELEFCEGEFVLSLEGVFELEPPCAAFPFS